MGLVSALAVVVLVAVCFGAGLVFLSSVGHAL